MKSKLVICALAFSTLSGCSSIISKNSYPVAINSSPDQAAFEVMNRNGTKIHSGNTPETVVLKSSSGFFKGEQYKVVLRKAGYAEQTIEIKSTIDGWYFGNLLFGGVIGMLIVDPATGSMYNLPKVSDTQLREKNRTSSVQQPRSIEIKSINELSTEQVARLDKLN